MEWRELTPDDATGMAAYAGVSTASNALEAPWHPARTPHRVEMMLRHGWDGEPGRLFVGCDARGVPVVAASVDVSTRDNLDAAWHQVMVHPDHRRRGHGSEALAFLERTCLEMGRPLVGTGGWDVAASREFARAHGYVAKAVDVQRRMPVREVPAATIRSVYDAALGHATDYELVRIAGRSPEELLAPLAAVAEAINDAPLDDLVMEDEVIDADRLRGYETARIESGDRLYRVVARHRRTGELAGHTVVVVDGERDTRAEQHDTSVVAAHRGHRLGLLLKADMVRWLAEAEPRLETIDTWNSESNRHMIAVNEALGYVVLGRGVVYQRDLGPTGGRVSGR